MLVFSLCPLCLFTFHSLSLSLHSQFIYFLDVSDYITFHSVRKWAYLGTECVTEQIYVHAKCKQPPASVYFIVVIVVVFFFFAYVMLNLYMSVGYFACA